MATNAYGFNDSKLKVYIDDAIQEAIDSVDFSEQIKNSLQSVYPIGAIYISTTSANPATYLGFGTWTAYGPGRTLVCVNPSDSTFASVRATGGHKELQKHNHKFTSIFHLRNSKSTAGNVNEDVWKGSGSTNFSYVNESDSTPNYYKAGTSGSGKSTKITISGNTTDAGTGTGSNLPPYITAYIWERTA